MMNKLRSLSLLLVGLILWGCASEAVQALPTIDRASPPTLAVTASAKPSSTAPSLIATGTATPQASITTPVLCQPGELESYLAEFLPIADQIRSLAGEVLQAEELPISRAEEMLAATMEMKPDLDSLTVPTCLESVHRQAVSAVNLLESGINAVLEEDTDTARDELGESLSAIAGAIADIAIVSWELTATSTPTQ